MSYFDRYKTGEEIIEGRKAKINELLAKIEKLKATLEDNPKADDKNAVRNHSPREALNIAKKHLERCLTALKPDGKGLDHARTGNAESFINPAEEYLNTN